MKTKKRIRIYLLIIIAIFFIIALVLFINSNEKDLINIDYGFSYPSHAYPVTLESRGNINLLAGESKGIAIRILNTLNETVNINIFHRNDSDCFNQNNPDQSILKFVPNKIENIERFEFIELKGYIKTAGTILEQKNQIVECPFVVELNGKTSNVKFSRYIIRIKSR